MQNRPGLSGPGRGCTGALQSGQEGGELGGPRLRVPSWVLLPRAWSLVG